MSMCEGESEYVCVSEYLVVCNVETCTMRRPRPDLGGCATRKKYALLAQSFIITR